MEKRKRIPICSFIIKAFFIVKALDQVFSSKKRLYSELYKFYEIFIRKTYTRSRYILSDCYSKYQIVDLKNSHFIFFYYKKGSSRNPEGKKSYLSGSKKINGMSYDQFLRFIFPERECLIILSCLISKKNRIG